MASSLSLRCGKAWSKPMAVTRGRRSGERKEANFFRPNQQIVMHARCSLTTSLQEVGVRNLFNKRQDRQRKIKDPVSPEKLDQWVTDLVSEIVRNVGETPLLVHVYSDNGDKSSMKVLEMERAMPEIWPQILMRWNKGSTTPDGLILVEELKDEEAESDGGSDSGIGNVQSGSRSWGIVVQGRGAGCASCYILKTSRVDYCTHFCLVRAKCFGETPELQMRNCWLQNQ